MLLPIWGIIIIIMMIVIVPLLTMKRVESLSDLIRWDIDRLLE